MTPSDRRLTREEKRLLPPTSPYEPKDARAVIKAFDKFEQCEGRPCIPFKQKKTSSEGLDSVFVGLLLTSPFISVIIFLSVTTALQRLGITAGRQDRLSIFLTSLLVGLVLFYPVYLIWRLRQADAKFGQARLLFKQNDLRLGDEVYFEYERQLREPSADMGWVSGHVACVEIVRTRQGTDLSYSETVLWEHTFDPAPLPARRQVYKAYWNVTLPKDLPISHMEKERWDVWHWQFGDDFGKHRGTYDLNLKTLPALRPLD